MNHHKRLLAVLLLAPFVTACDAVDASAPAPALAPTSPRAFDANSILPGCEYGLEVLVDLYDLDQAKPQHQCAMMLALCADDNVAWCVDQPEPCHAHMLDCWERYAICHKMSQGVG